LKKESNSKIGFVGLSHLGIVTSAGLSSKGFETVCFDNDAGLVNLLKTGVSNILEPGLSQILQSSTKLQTFTNEIKALELCDIIYISKDVSTDSSGVSDTSEITDLIQQLKKEIDIKVPLVILCQVPPGYSRNISSFLDTSVYYQVETLIFGDAINRTLYPERYIIGSLNPQEPLPEIFQKILQIDSCPIFHMSYESAELTKISINLYLAADVSLSNSLAEVCNKIGADWEQIIPALRMDKRIGEFAYLRPGLGISGGNIERDIVSITKMSEKFQINSEIFKSYLNHSKYQKFWASRTLESLIDFGTHKPNIGVLGLTYKENTHSTKNSPSIANIKVLQNRANIFVHDPVVTSIEDLEVTFVKTPEEIFHLVDFLLVLTPWESYKKYSTEEMLLPFRGKVILDPFKLFDDNLCRSLEIDYLTLGK
jgi:UDPglucose 6-dehydrogenase